MPSAAAATAAGVDELLRILALARASVQPAHRHSSVIFMRVGSARTLAGTFSDRRKVTRAMMENAGTEKNGETALKAFALFGPSFSSPAC